MLTINKLIHASTGASSFALISGVSTIGTAFTVVGLSASSVVSTFSTCVGACLLLSSKSIRRSY